MFIGIYSSCCPPQQCVEKNKTLLRMAETGVSITVLVIGILIDLHAMPGSQICGYIVTIAGGVWSVGNVIVIAISTSRQTPTATKKKMLPTEKELRSNKGRHQKTNPKNNSLPGGSTRTSGVSRPNKDSSTQRNASINDEDPVGSLGGSTQARTLSGPRVDSSTQGSDSSEDEDSVGSTSNRGGAAGGGNPVESEEEEGTTTQVDSPKKPEEFGLPEGECIGNLQLGERINRAKTLFEGTFNSWVRSGYFHRGAQVGPKSEGDAKMLKQAVLRDFDCVLHMPSLTVQERYDRLREMFFLTDEVFFGFDLTSVTSGLISRYNHPIVLIPRVASTFNVALQVLVHSQLGDYFLCRPLKMPTAPTLVPPMAEPPIPSVNPPLGGTREEEEIAMKDWRRAEARYKEWRTNQAQQRDYNSLYEQFRKNYKVWELRVELQTLVKSIVSQMRVGSIPSEEELKRIAKLKEEIFKTLNVAEDKRPEDSTWLMEQFGIVLKTCLQWELQDDIIVNQSNYWNIIFATSASGTESDTLYVKRNDDYYTFAGGIVTRFEGNAETMQSQIRKANFTVVRIPTRDPTNFTPFN